MQLRAKTTQLSQKSKYAFDEIFMAIFALAERVPTSATLLLFSSGVSKHIKVSSDPTSVDKKWSHSPRGFQQEAPQHELDRVCKERETALGLALERWVWFGRFDLRGLVC